jgi:hypothetical protein
MVSFTTYTTLIDDTSSLKTISKDDYTNAQEITWWLLFGLFLILVIQQVYVMGYSAATSKAVSSASKTDVSSMW